MFGKLWTLSSVPYYMEKEPSKAIDLTMSEMALMQLSEEDIHHLFVESI